MDFQNPGLSKNRSVPFTERYIGEIVSNWLFPRYTYSLNSLSIEILVDTKFHMDLHVDWACV